MKIKIVALPLPRLRVRRIFEDVFAESNSRDAQEKREWTANVIHGGGVANAYGYPAATECALAVSDPSGLTYVWTGRTAARGVTERAAAEACLPGSGDLFDKRVSRTCRIDDAWSYLKYHHARQWSSLEMLASQTCD